MSKKVLKELNKQLNYELQSAHLYLAISAKMVDLVFDGFKNWFLKQYQEEQTHATKQFEYLANAGFPIDIKGFDISTPKITKPVDAFKFSLKHEKVVSSRINDLMQLAHEEKDFATISFLNWFVLEQVEEESSLIKIIDDLNKVEDGTGLYLMDKELGARV